ncbi:hypothetical protein N0V93_008710 [Gnomoniopsis smithogilvyi]|uniref:Golgi apparatus membrane protein TVP38 n=1 Tax=Gnomoniopsis smithogilvyi TaxID=1191159 RepID=A0A9W8YQJ5_9PEZI|nr:hypothetical protein N0V93_008710 [Gnomoniopsis smithogilvyi]
MDNSHQYSAAPATYPPSSYPAEGQTHLENQAETAPLSPAANDGTYHNGYGENQGYGESNYHARDDSPTTDDPPTKRRISKKTQQRLYWVIPLLIVLLILAILFEVYKSDFERWVTPLTDWLDAREAWSWVIPVVILLVLSFPPLFGHEIVLLVVGLAYPLGIAIGIACAGSIIGEALCFVVFKFFLSKYAEKRMREKVKWAAVGRLAKESGFWGVLVIRYSIVPPRMKFWIYMATVIASLPKVIVFVALGTPSSEHSKGARAAKIVAIGIVVVITLFATRWIRQKMAIVTKEIEAERAVAGGGSPGTVPGDVEMGNNNSRTEQDLK